ncbi:MAG: PaaI family thioesterase [Actinobacteria bacterium]|nr:PaaI family thioesterase [Actinomycetota bacterium]MCG2818518.1 PaaI family thioesterase [Actinomycetes bacterium]MBU4218293.1 PaaI family thioesterase [Actinomycetota bacterium]MBU4358718.1 PaaI family thioesterase [Actinomycetota bacterium]MBU4391886.1 PaaI family thioesterase [Actinomycetota bacterium]
MEEGAGNRLWGACSAQEEETYKAIVRDRVENSPFYLHMGLRVTGLGRGWATFEMAVGKRFWNVGGVVHGGALMSIADAAAGVSLATLLDRDERPVTIEGKLNFCSPVTEGVIEARGEVVKKGKLIAVCDVEVTEGDRLVAKGISTYMVVSPEE